MKPDPPAVERLHLFSFFDAGKTILALKKELLTYVAAADGTEVNDGEQLQGWYCHKKDLPKCANAVKHLVLVQPSSALAEGFFPSLSHF